jgi:hypothetical protein
MVQKYIYYTFFLCAIPAVSFCMEPDDPRRNNVNELYPLCTTKKHIGDTTRVCHDYAIGTSIGKFGEFPPQHQYWYSAHNILKHYEKTDSPQKGDLVVYRTNSLLFRLQYNTAIQHTGLVEEDGMVKSKWALDPHIYTHPTFCIPASYGETVSYYRKKDSDEKIYRNMLHKTRHAALRICLLEMPRTIICGLLSHIAIRLTLYGLIVIIKKICMS